VVLIRGGGSKLDLGWLDSDALARAIAASKRPVWTGIGHETDSSVLDHVAAKSFRTPTAVAEALAAHFEDILRRLEDSEARLRRAYTAMLELRVERLARASHTLQHAPLRLIEVRRAGLEARANALNLRASKRVAVARAAWVAQVERMQRGASIGLVERRHRLARTHERLAASSVRVLERKLAALSELARRIERLNIAERFAAERTRLAHQQRSLKQVAQRRASEAHAALHTAARDTQARTAAAIAQARVTLAPKMQLMQAAFRMRAQLTSARIAELQAKLARSSERQMRQLRERLTHTQQQFKQELVAERCDRERLLLEAHGRVLRTSDPRRALELGYSITYAADGSLIRSAAQLAPGQQVTTQIADGSFEAVVKTVGEKHD
jgi:exonuclease VII large subunit